jgi:hypothetical protein
MEANFMCVYRKLKVIFGLIVILEGMFIILSIGGIMQPCLYGKSEHHSHVFEVMRKMTPDGKYMVEISTQELDASKFDEKLTTLIDAHKIYGRVGMYNKSSTLVWGKYTDHPFKHPSPSNAIDFTVFKLKQTKSNEYTIILMYIGYSDSESVNYEIGTFTPVKNSKTPPTIKWKSESHYLYDEYGDWMHANSVQICSSNDGSRILVMLRRSSEVYAYQFKFCAEKDQPMQIEGDELLLLDSSTANMQISKLADDLSVIIAIYTGHTDPNNNAYFKVGFLGPADSFANYTLRPKCIFILGHRPESFMDFNNLIISYSKGAKDNTTNIVIRPLFGERPIMYGVLNADMTITWYQKPDMFLPMHFNYSSMVF